MATFTFAGTTIVAPGFILRSTIGTQNVLQLLPFGTICMVGAADGGLGSGTVYIFNNIQQAQQVLRAGPLLNALQTAANVGGASGFVACVAGTKTPATLDISTGTADHASGTITVGGTWVGGTDVANVTIDGHETTYDTVSGDTTNALIAQHLASAIQANSMLDGLVTVTVNANVITVTAVAEGTEGEYSFTATKTSASGTLTASSATLAFADVVSATFESGDAGTWNNSITVAFATGTTSGFMTTFTYPDPITGQTQTIGGAGTAFDNLASLVALQTAMEANSLITPAVGTGYQPLLTLAVAVDGVPANMAATPLSGGTGSGAQSLTNTDYETAIAELIDVSFDLGHLVGCYSSAPQVAADQQAQLLYPLGYLRTWVHQCQTSASPSQDKIQNSAAVVSSGVAAAQALNSPRSSMCAQKLNVLSPQTGQFTFVDAAWVYIGQIALDGATGANGPATPITFDYLATAADVDYQVLKTTGDQDRAILGGLVIFERVSTAGPGSVRVVQSVTTAPNGSNGSPWIFSELSVQRVSDALLANVKAYVEQASPKAIGAGNTVKVSAYILSVVRDILELALQANWITSFNPSSIAIGPSGTNGTDLVVSYSAAPTLPLNHLAVDQTLIPFQAPVSVGGSVNG